MNESMQRNPLVGSRGAVTSGHYLASLAGMEAMREGGNAIDAAAATGLCLGLLEPHQNGMGGEVPTLIHSAREGTTYAISGMGWSPKSLTIDWCREHGIEMIPGDGYLPACVPSVIGSWTLALSRFGTMSFSLVARPAIELAEEGFPMYAELRGAIESNRERFAGRYPSTGRIYLPDGRVPELGERFRNPDLANTLRLMCAAEETAAGKGREAGLEAVRDAFYRGEIAERIVEFGSSHRVLDDSGREHACMLTLDDFAQWQPAVERPESVSYRGLDVHKCSSWTQGPVFLQQLTLLEGFDLAAMGHGTADYLHTWIECAKLAFADREAHYGDPALDSVPFDLLLSKGYADERRRLVGDRASLEMRPGDGGSGIAEWDLFDVLADNRRALGLGGGGEGAAGANSHANDTTQLDTADAEGNMVAATPSGGWIPSSPVIEGLGFPLGTRGQMFYLNAARPNALAPRKRPRATLTPTIVTRDGRPLMAFGTAGGDAQDQWTLQFFLNHIDFGMDLQQALDAPPWTVTHFPSSFYPRGADPGGVQLAGDVPTAVADALKERGHKVLPMSEPYIKPMGIRRDEDRGVLITATRTTPATNFALAW